MSEQIAIPDVLRICDRCGDVACGACESCAEINAEAKQYAGELVESGLIPRFRHETAADKKEKLWLETVETQLHCLRAAKLNASLPLDEMAKPRARKNVRKNEYLRDIVASYSFAFVIVMGLFELGMRGCK